ncbi:phosphate starvation-inducible protein PhoH [Desulfonatronum thiosulfatophilum]|uniref:PhoH-like protein n=1 Tax=Desulfonatronum thiosulfatophilum TaxID=617002 RepID=A0A1G6DC59_9BACT|nr:PhoH family protein [Desulfonatronum thiosulfatophilum]SDB42756.1 phosphate starvation-inducible protein PhoH [Desulfonatronum thiosulfatophilum]
MTIERRLEFQSAAEAQKLFGPHNAHLLQLAELSGISVDSHGSVAVLNGQEPELVDLVANCLVQLHGLLRANQTITTQDVDHAWRILSQDPKADIKSVFKDVVYAVSPKRTITPRTVNQRHYLQAIRKKDLVFGIGPAGTGKTYLAVAMAVSALIKKEVKRLVLTRPAVEAGEKLGFLPGDLAEKINPYLRPLYDALHDMVEFRKVQEMLEDGMIEIAPLAFMRGRTLNDSFIILDEAQNTTPEQMKMFLTRLGFGSKAVVTGDITQIDLPIHARSGLIQAERVLSKVSGLQFIHFNDKDVIRHPLVGRIVTAYDRYSQQDFAKKE